MPYWFLKMVWNMMKWYYKSATVEEYNIWYVVANKAELLKAVWLTASMLMSSLVHKMPFGEGPDRGYTRGVGCISSVFAEWISWNPLMIHWITQEDPEMPPIFTTHLWKRRQGSAAEGFATVRMETLVPATGRPWRSWCTSMGCQLAWWLNTVWCWWKCVQKRLKCGNSGLHDTV